MALSGGGTGSPIVAPAESGTSAADLLARTRDLLGEELADLYDDVTEILPALNEGKDMMFSELDIIPATLTIPVTANVAAYALPSTFSRFNVVKLSGAALSHVSALEIDPIATTGTSGSYNGDAFDPATGERLITLFPTPSTDGTLVILAWCHPADLSLSEEAPQGPSWHKKFHFLPCYHAAAELFYKDKRPEYALLMEQKFEAGIIRYRQWWNRNQPARVYKMQSVSGSDM